MKVKKSIFLVIFLSLVFFLGPNVLHGRQEKETSQEKEKLKLHHEIVVTATRLETPALEIGNAIVVIPAEELRKQGLATVAEALAQLTHCFLTQNGGAGAAASVLLRGANSEHTLVLIDGVEVNDPVSPSRAYDLSHLLLADVERIEILPGAQSPLYGSDAMAGVIHIITKKRDLHRFTLASEAGSFSTLHTNMSIGGKLKGISYRLSGARFQTGGVSAASSFYAGNKEKDGYTNTSASGHLFWPLGSQKEIELNFRYLKARTDLDNYGGPYGDDPNNQQDMDTFLGKVNYRSLSLGSRWEQRISLSFVLNSRENSNPEDATHPAEREEGRFKSCFFQFDWQNNWFLTENHTLTFGVEQEQEEAESDYLWLSAYGRDRSYFPAKKATSTGIYIQDHAKLSSSFFLTAGLRADHHSRAGLAVTYRLAQSYFLEATSTKFRASLGSGFKAPSLYQLYAPATFWGPIGNASLKPEKNFSWDIGLEQILFHQRVIIQLNYFFMRFRNLIQFDYASGYQNVGRAETWGWQLEAYMKPFSFVRTNLNFGWVKARDLTHQTPLLRRPDFQAKAEFEIKFSPSWKLLFSVTRVGEREDIDYSNWIGVRVKMPGFTLARAALILWPENKFSFHLRLENLTNCRYELVKGYGTPGFSVYTGFAFSF